MDNDLFLLSRRTVHTLTPIKTSLQRPPLYNINSHYKQYKARHQLPKKTSRQRSVFQRLVKKLRMVMKFDPYDALIINRSNCILIVFHPHLQGCMQ